MEITNTLVVANGPAGLAIGASLNRRGVSSIVLEKGETAAPGWHEHRERFYLQTDKAALDNSALRCSAISLVTVVSIDIS